MLWVLIRSTSVRQITFVMGTHKKHAVKSYLVPTTYVSIEKQEKKVNILYYFKKTEFDI